MDVAGEKKKARNANENDKEGEKLEEGVISGRGGVHAGVCAAEERFDAEVVESWCAGFCVVYLITQ